MEFVKSKVINQEIFSRTDRYPLFVTPDEIYDSPFLFSQEVVLEIALDPSDCERIEGAVITNDPLHHPLLVRYGCRAAINNYNTWWTNWRYHQEDCLYLGKKPDDIHLLLFMLEVALGRRFWEKNYMPV